LKGTENIKFNHGAGFNKNTWFGLFVCCLNLAVTQYLLSTSALFQEVMMCDLMVMVNDYLEKTV